MSDSKSSIYNRGLGTSLPDPVRIELNRLNRAHVRETNQAACDAIEAKIQAIEAEHYAKAKPVRKPRVVKPSPVQADEPSPKQEKRAPKPSKKPAKQADKPAARPRKKA